MQYRSRVAILRCCHLPLGARHASSQSFNGGRERVNWTAERLKPTEKYPLSKTLSARTGAATKGLYKRNHIPIDRTFSGSSNTFVRTQIVSPDLCDDVLKYIGPTLEKHKGCDILDLNPGVGLWSRKIHDFLQPRSHVLVEPTPALYNQYLQPLVDEPNSRYTLFNKNTTKHKTYMDLIDEGAFPHQKRVYHDSDEGREQNNTLLVTGSLMWDPKLPGLGFDSMAKQLVLQWAAKAWECDVFHAFGPVRTLLWTTHDETKTIIPRSEHLHGKYSFIMNMLSKNTEVVTSSHTKRLAGRATIGRKAQYEIESIVRALQRGRENGMVLPTHRRENAHDFAESVEKMTNGSGIMGTADMNKFLEEQEKAGKSTTGFNSEAAIRSYKMDKAREENPYLFMASVPSKEKEFEKFKTEGKTEDIDLPIAEEGDIPIKLRRQKGINPERKAANVRRATVNRNNSLMVEVETRVDIGQDLYDLECKILRMKEGPKREAELEKLRSMEEEFDASLFTISQNYRTQIDSGIDDRLALSSPVPRLQWDSRPYEPLVMQPDEVWPAQHVSLIDSEPRPLPPGETIEYYEWVHDFVLGLFLFPALSVNKALEKLQPGASDIIDQAPSLKDPAKGGRLNMKYLRVRMLTVEMVSELCKAYREWPFRNPEVNHPRYFQLRVRK